ncbi:choice-of-anchor E domain-containing protein [Aerosakkonema sp. BLCC-F183]|uniref:choice-of-anchor E domain-containing protein n=1 Tax=Aerosakkonema sp. BLCC-F183 TaxID=3342834 RepID=UPI0035B6EA80
MKAHFFKAVTAVTALTAVMATNDIAKAASFTCSTIYGAGNDATRICSTSLAPSLTDIIDESLFLPQFNSSELGTLNSVTLEFTGLLAGGAGFESKDAKSTTITVELGGLLTLQDLNGQSLFALNPKKSYNYSVTNYDGIINFAGTSGKTIDGVTAQQTGQKIYTGSELATFIGAANIEYLFSAEAKSKVTGTGNIISYVDTFAGADLKVSYQYTRKVPEPSVIFGLGAAVILAILVERKKFSKKASNKLEVELQTKIDTEL